MNAAVQQIPATSAKEIPAGTAYIVGRVERSTRNTGRDGTYYTTLIKTPAPDEFSSPSTLEVTSPEQLGAKGDSVRVKVRIFGYSRSYNTKPSRDYPEGEVRYTADNRLEVVG
ncbi:MAG: hypothetical protein QFE16_04485 [Pseudomonadota bacterium]|nr:hypothetical protein [Pseudomonadota bacterium]